MIDLSIVVPIYNVEKYLEECLETLYQLNLKKEIILVNDESKDNSMLIIKKYKIKYPNETIVIDQKNKGLSGARNSGLKIARGEYIAFIDSDDFINSCEYEEFFLKNKNKKLDIMIGNYRRYKDGKFLEVCKRDMSLNNLGIITGKEFFKKSIQLNSFQEEVWDDIYNKNFLIKNRLIFKERLLHEDNLFFIQVLSKAKRVEFFNTPIYNYRQRENSIMATMTSKNSMHKLFIIEKLLKLQKEENNSIENLNKYLINILWSVFRFENKTNLKILLKIIREKQKYSAKEYLKISILLINGIFFKNIKFLDNEKIKNDCI